MVGCSGPGFGGGVLSLSELRRPAPILAVVRTPRKAVCPGRFNRLVEKARVRSCSVLTVGTHPIISKSIIRVISLSPPKGEGGDSV